MPETTGEFARAAVESGVRLLSAFNFPQDRRTPVVARYHAVEVAGDLTDVEALKLCVCELVTNSVLHADPGVITMLLYHEYRHGQLRIEVIDNGGPTVPVATYDLKAEAYRGMFLVEQLATGWSYYRDGDGLATWCVLPATRTPGRPSRNG